MRMRPFGNSGLLVSPVGLGAGHIGSAARCIWLAGDDLEHICGHGNIRLCRRGILGNSNVPGGRAVGPVVAVGLALPDIGGVALRLPGVGAVIAAAEGEDCGND